MFVEMEKPLPFVLFSAYAGEGQTETRLTDSRSRPNIRALHIVDGRHLAPVDMENLALFTGFYTSQVVGLGISSINSTPHIPPPGGKPAIPAGPYLKNFSRRVLKLTKGLGSWEAPENTDMAPPKIIGLLKGGSKGSGVP